MKMSAYSHRSTEKHILYTYVIVFYNFSPEYVLSNLLITIDVHFILLVHVIVLLDCKLLIYFSQVHLKSYMINMH